MSHFYTLWNYHIKKPILRVFFDLNFPVYGKIRVSENYYLRRVFSSVFKKAGLKSSYMLQAKKLPLIFSWPFISIQSIGLCEIKIINSENIAGPVFNRRITNCTVAIYSLELTRAIVLTGINNLEMLSFFVNWRKGWEVRVFNFALPI